MKRQTYLMHMAHAHNNPAHFGIRTERYELIFFYGCDFTDIHYGKTVAKNDGNRYYPNTLAAWELYDLRADPKEMHNQYGNPQYKKVIAELKKELKRQREELKETDAKYPCMQKIIDAYGDS